MGAKGEKERGSVGPRGPLWARQGLASGPSLGRTGSGTLCWHWILVTTISYRRYRDSSF